MPIREGCFISPNRWFRAVPVKFTYRIETCANGREVAEMTQDVKDWRVELMGLVAKPSRLLDLAQLCQHVADENPL